MHIGSIQQIDEDDQSEQTKDGRFWVVTGGDEEIFFCIGQTNHYIHMGRYIPTSRSTTVARDTAMASQMAKDAPKMQWMMLAQDQKRLPPEQLIGRTTVLS